MEVTMVEEADTVSYSWLKASGGDSVLHLRPVALRSGLASTVCLP